MKLQHFKKDDQGLHETLTTIKLWISELVTFLLQ